MSNLVFISYRRDDAISEAGRIADALIQALGRDSVFADTFSIEPGQVWAQRIEDALRVATVIVVVIGQEWLKISDEWGQRRIDQSDDWVRKELELALTSRIKVLPVLVNGAKLPPRRDLMPPTISGLLDMQAVDIRPQYWNHDILLLVERVKALAGGERKSTPTYYPGKPSINYPDPLAEEKLEVILRKILCQWAVVRSPLPDDPSRDREELFRTYQFKNFVAAMDFMTQVAQGCEMHGHHPRWENIWNKLSVYLTTWGKGYRITDRDIRLAQYLDKSYRKFPGAIGDD